MKTAALLPTPGNPYLVRYWLNNYDRVWRGEVDELRVHVNQQPDPTIRTWIQEQVESLGGVYSERTSGSSHGLALADLVSATDADVVLLCEDDGLVRKVGAVSLRLARVRDGHTDVIASPRGSMTPGLESAALRRWGTTAIPEYPYAGNGGPGMWPAFVFARRDVLLATDGNYDSCAWDPGDTVRGLGWVVDTERECADTLGSMALQLRSFCRVEDDVQYKGPHLWDYWLGTGHDIPWFHTGSLSSSGDLCGDDPPMPGPSTSTTFEEKQEWAHRLHWWRRCFDACRDEFPERADAYARNWERLRASVDVPMGLVDGWAPTVDQMVTWDESP